MVFSCYCIREKVNNNVLASFDDNCDSNKTAASAAVSGADGDGYYYKYYIELFTSYDSHSLQRCIKKFNPMNIAYSIIDYEHAQKLCCMFSCIPWL